VTTLTLFSKALPGPERQVFQATHPLLEAIGQLSRLPTYCRWTVHRGWSYLGEKCSLVVGVQIW